VAAVGGQDSSATGFTPPILQDAGSAPKGPTKAAPLAASPMSRETSTAPPTRATTMPARLDAARVGQLFPPAGAEELPVSAGGHRSQGHKVAENADLDALADDIWFLVAIDAK